jgi:(p)ppGpp synthase/HD superfamily hydrolase
MMMPAATLECLSEIATEAPCLLSAAQQLNEDDLSKVEELYARVMAEAAYLEDMEPEESVRFRLRLALEVAFLAHHGQQRKSGDAFVMHPVEVALILAQAKMDLPSVVSGLLHDTVEDTQITFAEIGALFGADVRKIVEGETKVNKLPKVVQANLEKATLEDKDKQDEQAENLRSMFVAMADDWRIVVVKLADRLHNMRTLEFMPVHKQISIARETIEIFAPLAHRLGMYEYRTELSDLAFKYLFPRDYEMLKAHIDARSAE